MKPEYKNKSASEIMDIDFPLDSVTYFYVAVCWFDLFKRKGNYLELLNSSISARMGIEYLLFEEILLSCEQGLTEEEYKKCLKDRRKLEKVLLRLQPDYTKLKEFTQAFAEIEPTAPRLIIWNFKKLLNQWGVLSSLLHWSGSWNRTTMSKKWLEKQGEKIGDVVEGIWFETSSGSSGIMNVKDMKPGVKEIWQDFRTDKISAKIVTKRLKVMKLEVENA